MSSSERRRPRRRLARAGPPPPPSRGPAAGRPGHAGSAAPATRGRMTAGRLAIASCVGTDEQGPKRFGAKGKLAFTLGNVAQDEGAAMAEYAIQKGWKRAITVSDNLLEYFRDGVEAFT